MTHRSLASFLALLALGAAACGGPSGGRLEPVHRLVDAGVDPLAADVPPACAADDEIRPAFGCIAAATLEAVTPLETGTRPLRRRYRLPPALAGRPIVVEPVFQSGEKRTGWKPLPGAIERAPGAEIDVSFAVPEDVEEPVFVNARARPIQPPAKTIETRPLDIGTDAVLTFGVALEPVGGTELAAAPVEFRVVADTPDGTWELFRTVVDPGDPAAFRWTDHRLDLSELAGRAVRFVFSTRVLPRSAAPPDEAFGFPLWGAPQVLEPGSDDAQHNLLLISLDTLRADYVSAYGCDLPTTPELDRLAAEGALFEQVISPYPSTPPSHMSMLTGLYPSAHGVVGPFQQLPASIPTLPELLTAHGYETAAVTENAMLLPTSGFQRGFTYYRENKRTSIWDATGQVDATFDAGLRWLQRHRGKKFFLFLHTYQVHEPYSPPPAFDVFTTYQVDGRPAPITETTPGAIRTRHAYAGEVRYVDSELRRLLDGLAALGEAERTLVVVTSDHGEEFFEHGWWGHSESVYDEVLRVPLVMRAPGLVPAGVRVPGQVSLVDLTPTLLDLLGVPVPDHLQGTSLSPLLHDPAAPGFAERIAFAELERRNPRRRLLAARTSRLKWIFYEGLPRSPEVYDLRTDPGERQNLADPELLAEGQALVEQYRASMAAWRARLGEPEAGEAAPAPPTLDERTVEKLRALGYAEPADAAGR